MSAPLRITFVCLGNICRSPLAEGAFRALVAREGLAARFAIESAGTGDYHVGEPADARSVRVAAARGIDISGHRARCFTARDFARFDRVIAMDLKNLRDLGARGRGDGARAKLALMRSFDPAAHPQAEVPDPYYGSMSDFEHVLDLCQAASEGLLEALLREGR